MAPGKEPMPPNTAAVKAYNANNKADIEIKMHHNLVL